MQGESSTKANNVNEASKMLRCRQSRQGSLNEVSNTRVMYIVCKYIQCMCNMVYCNDRQTDSMHSIEKQEIPGEETDKEWT